MQLNLIPKSRSKILAYITLGIMAIFVVRLFYLQVIRHDYYVGLANQEQLKQLIIPSKRGEIYTMDGSTPTKVVLNETVYTMFVDPKIVTKPDGIIETLRQIAGGNMRKDPSELIAMKNSRYQILATKLSRVQAEKIKEKHYTGVGFQAESQRVYPEGQLAAQVFGFVNAEGKGQYGIEESLNSRLTGKDGLLQSVTDVSNVPLTIGNNNINRPAVNGDNIVLTIDRNVQAYAEKALQSGLKRSGATNGSVMVMDPQTGKIMAMANFPTYNPAEYNKVQNADAFNNAAISEPYEAGSDIKTLTVATGLDKGVIEPDSTYNNTDFIRVDDKVISNATKGQTGTITIQHALNWSLNTGMVTIAQRLGDGQSITLKSRNTMYAYFHDKFRLGQSTGIELAGEARGTIIPPTEQEGNAVRYSNMSFGQGMDVTVIQVCAAFSAIINGGTYNTPSVISGTLSDDGSRFSPAATKTSEKNVISRTASDKVRQMIREARNTFYAGKDKPGYQIGGKTGTSQTLIDGNYNNNQTIGTYLGFGGNEMPRYVIMVEVSGKNMSLAGNKDAMPIFTDLSNWMIDYLKLQPKG